MNRMQGGLVAGVLLLVAAALQQSVAQSISIGPSSPDFFLVVLGALSPFLNRVGAATVGLVAGIVHGALIGASLAHYVVSRVIAGFALGWSNDLRLAPNVAVAMVSTVAGTVLAQLVHLFLAPPKDILGYLTATIVSAVYNGVLVIPLYALLNRVLDRRIR